MAEGAIIAIDQGTTNTKALLVDIDGTVLASAAVGMSISYPKPGWVEQDAEDIWRSVATAIDQVLTDTPSPPVRGVAISNQRETVVLWDASTGTPVAPAISWQCRRSADICERLREQGSQQAIETRSGLQLDPMFPAGKIAWLLNSDPNIRKRAERGELRVGTIDSWLLWKLTGGDVHATDHSNASRTQLYSLQDQTWDERLLDHFAIPQTVLPLIRPSAAVFGETGAKCSPLPEGVSVLAMMGDSHAALFAHGLDQPGRAKVTIGTGASFMAPTDSSLDHGSGLSRTIAWHDGADAKYALEGNIIAAGDAVRFATRLLGLSDENELAALALTVPSSDGVCFVPALAGLGAPHWDPKARGIVDGMSMGTGPAHIARAALEAVAHQIADVVEVADQKLRAPLTALVTDGGASSNSELLRAVASFTGKQVIRANLAEASAIGAARMAMNTLGERAWSVPPPDHVFFPGEYFGDRDNMRARWRHAIGRALSHPPG